MARKGKLGKKAVENEVIRPVRIKRYKYLLLIVCEDQKTEPGYFGYFAAMFPPETLYLKPVGTGLDPLGVVNSAVSERGDLEDESGREVDCVWVVFDKDDANLNETRIHRFNEAFSTSKTERFNVAYSNEVFELWLLLHLVSVDHTKEIPRKVIYEQLQEAIRNIDGYQNFEYEHGNDNILSMIFDLGDESNAITRAEHLLTFHADKQPIDANPSTRMHILVKEIREWIKYFSYNP